MEAAEVGFKKPLSKEEQVMKKKERLAAIGNVSGLITCLSLGLDDSNVFILQLLLM
jgi:hypothetical protein